MLAAFIYIPESSEFYKAAPLCPLKLSESEREKSEKGTWWWPVAEMPVCLRVLRVGPRQVAEIWSRCVLLVTAL